jgi:hypothetical protein
VFEYDVTIDDYSITWNCDKCSQLTIVVLIRVRMAARAPTKTTLSCVNVLTNGVVQIVGQVSSRLLTDTSKKLGSLIVPLHC